MNRMNYFNSFKTKDDEHEDQLTRAYLVLLKHSSHAFFTFFEYCRNELKVDKKESPITLLDYLQDDWIIETQRSNPDITTDNLISILITDKNLPYDKRSTSNKVEADKRNAVYDGVITFGKKLTMIIENKPDARNVWIEQLNPSENGLYVNYIYNNHVDLQWKEIIKQLRYLLELSTISGYEKIMIKDFLLFVNINFPLLNPFDKFSLCDEDDVLINRRIETLLQSIVRDDGLVKKQRGWGYYIQLPYSLIKMAGLILKKNDEDWELELFLSYGEILTRAREIYNSNLDIAKLNELKDWKKFNNFHVAKNSDNLVFFKSSMDICTYIQYWINNVEIIKQAQNQNEVDELLNSLHKQGVIVYDKEKEEEMMKKYFKTQMQRLNICPGFALVYTIPSKIAIELDEKGELGKLLISKIKEGLSFANIDCKDILI